LAAAAAEMAFAGELGISLRLSDVPQELGDVAGAERDACLLFSESNTRFLCEVTPANCLQFERTLASVPCAANVRLAAAASTVGTRPPANPSTKLKCDPIPGCGLPGRRRVTKW